MVVGSRRSPSGIVPAPVTVFQRADIGTNMALQKMEFFSDENVDGLVPLKDDGTIRFTIDNRCIRVTGLEDGDHVELYTLDGKAVATAKSGIDGQAKIELPVAQTVYILKAGETTFKVRVK